MSEVTRVKPTFSWAVSTAAFADSTAACAASCALMSLSSWLCGNGPLFGQRTVAGEIPLGLRELCLRLSARCACACDRAFSKRSPVDFEQHLAFADERAFTVTAVDEIARYLRPDLRVDVAVEGGEPLAGELDSLRGNRNDPNLGWDWRRGSCGVTFFAGGRGQRGGNKNVMNSSHVLLSGYPVRLDTAHRVRVECR